MELMIFVEVNISFFMGLIIFVGGSFDMMKVEVDNKFLCYMEEVGVMKEVGEMEDGGS
jgi:hypothetical protein